VTPILRRVATYSCVTAGAVVLAFGVGAPPERCPEISVPRVEAAAAAAVGWIVRNQQPDGTWLYEYDRVDDAEADDYNMVRHAGLLSALYQAAARGIPGALESADRGLDWALANVVERDGWIGVSPNSTIQTGTNALMITGLVERRQFTGDDSYDELMAQLGRFLTSQVEPSGALLAYYDVGPDAPRPATYSIYYTGEAYWALGRLHRLDPAAGWGQYADRLVHYMATTRDDAEDIWPPLADHWSGYGLAETAAFPERTAGRPLTDAELEYARRLGGLIGQRVRSISERYGPWGVAVRGTFTPRGGGYGVFGEGLTGLWRTAQLDERLAVERGALGERATCIAGLAIEAQADAADASAYPDPGKVEGAWFIDDVTRMDDQQHALSALLLTVPILEAANPVGGHPAPSWWLWLIVIVGVLNPIRTARAIPGGDRRTRTESTAIGGVIGGALLVAVGSTSGWLLEALDVSRPAMRLAAAALCLIGAGIDFATRPGSPGAALEGRKAALVPVAVPLVMRPALLFAAVSVVADHSVPFHVLAIGVAVAATIAFTAADAPAESTGAGSVATAWGSRLFAAAAVVGSVLLIANAVFDI
jgi:small neutral amino acid transporter SnatA (MarC family)